MLFRDGGGGIWGYFEREIEHYFPYLWTKYIWKINALELCKTFFFLDAKTNCIPFKSVKTEIYDSLLKKKGIKPVRKGAGNARFVGTVVKSYEFLLLQGWYRTRSGIFLCLICKILLLLVECFLFPWPLVFDYNHN